ncbi:hypothetical protein ACFVYG_03140 [Streptomyces sp. NPDC058256]|uniref:hypothetical protein n=1 Tax=Streptomyces sp. NPDC058256 TaxID=3346408 RepID=UPI0036E57138
MGHDGLVRLVAPPTEPVDARGEWTAVESELGVRLPDDYEWLVEAYQWEDEERVQQRRFAAVRRAVGSSSPTAQGRSRAGRSTARERPAAGYRAVYARTIV